MPLTKATYSMIEGTPGNVRDYDLGTGGTSDTDAIKAALADNSGATVVLPYRATPWQISSKITIPANTSLRYEYGAQTVNTFDGDAFELNSNATIIDMYHNGAGAAYTSSRGVIITGTNGGQKLVRPRIFGTGLECLAFTTTGAGSRFECTGFDFARYGVVTAGQPVITIADGSLAGAAVPRKFLGGETNGWDACSLGGCNDIFFSGGYYGGFIFSQYSRGVKLTGLRWGGASLTATILGANISVTGCGISPALTLGSGVPGFYTSTVTIVGNDMNNPRILDSTLFPASNVLQHQIFRDDTILFYGGLAGITPINLPAADNFNGVYRNGSECCLYIDFSGDYDPAVALPAGLAVSSALQINVPADFMPLYEQYVGPITMVHNGTPKSCFGRLFGTTTGAGNYIRLGYFDGAGLFVGYNSTNLAGGNITRLTGTFRWAR